MRIGLCLLAALLLFASPAESVPVVVNPQVQVNAAQYSDAVSDSLSDEARVGYGLGGFLRVGDRWFFQPGIFLQKTSIQLQNLDSSVSDIEDDLGVSSVFIPVLFGFHIVDLGVVRLRGNAGPAATFVTAVDDNPFGLTKDAYEDLIWGGVLGAGADIAIVTVDVGYEIGFSNVFNQDQPGFANAEAKQNVWRLGAGLRFAF